MMIGIITTYEGASYTLPELISWRVSHTSGEPCGDFEVCFLYGSKLLDYLQKATRFIARYEGETVFTGVVDEFTVSLDSGGYKCTMSGRSMAALLLDNAVEAAAFETARFEDIVRQYVSPMGLATVDTSGMQPIELYSVSSGASRYDAVADFTIYSAGLTPWFDALGRMIVGSNPYSKLVRLGEAVSVSCRDKRYGVVSHVSYLGTMITGGFALEGGLCTKVIAEQSETSYKSGEQLARIALSSTLRDRRVLTVTVPKAFAAMPCDRVRLTGADLLGKGTYEVIEAESSGSLSGEMCVLTMV